MTKLQEILEELQKATLICLSKNSSVYDYKKAIALAISAIEGLVPDRREWEIRDGEYETGFAEGHNACREEMLRRVKK